jgi:hypothetical protein
MHVCPGQTSATPLALALCSRVKPIARPAAKTLIKGGLIAYQEAEQLYTGAVAGIGDMVAEAHQEIGATTARGAMPTGTVPAPLVDGCASNSPIDEARPSGLWLRRVRSQGHLASLQLPK